MKVNVDKASAAASSVNDVSSFTENKLTPAFRDQVALSMILSPPEPKSSALPQYNSCYSSFTTTEKPSQTYSEQISSTKTAKEPVEMNKNYNTSKTLQPNEHIGIIKFFLLFIKTFYRFLFTVY